MPVLPFIILLAPLIAAAMIMLVATRHSKALTAALAIGACAISLAGSVMIFIAPPGAEFMTLTWMSLPGLKIGIGAMTDSLARLMLLVVTGVGLFIQIFSCGYMSDDEGFSRFFAKMSFFMFSMLGVVLANNFVMMFIFWELVGLSSYLLIGFWFERPAAADAAKKAFIVNRIGDFGFMMGILLVWQIWQTISFSELQMKTAETPLHGMLVTLAALGIFCGCIGKSAQFPLHVWLPDAMEGPTPVSALIHAATMVAAGVYMLCRVSFILQLSTTAMMTIATIGAITAFLAALMAAQQNDIKRILAYSTMSQLGYMVMAVGLGAFAGAMFHLTTHAFFKALLFLAAGSVIHALHHERNIWKMGGLWRPMKITFATFCIGAAALTGVPFFSGFFSKESILLTAFYSNKGLFSLGILTAGITAFYMTRLLIVAFFRLKRSKAKVSESPVIMLVPLVALSICAIVGGYLNIDSYLHGIRIEDEKSVVIVFSILSLAVGVGLGTIFYVNADTEPLNTRLLVNKFYFDEIYQLVFVRAQDDIARISCWMDRWVIEGIFVRIPVVTGEMGGLIFRVIQNGKVSSYVLIFVAGVLFLFYWIVLA